MTNFIKKPWLLLPPGLAHNLSPYFLRYFGRTHPLQTLTWAPFSWRGLEFTNPLGTAGGVDKNADHIKDWWTLGTGFVEVGTVTPKPQEPNPGKIIERNVSQLALWNCMGFPNAGAVHAKKQIESIYVPHFTPIFVNIGKNRNTPNEKASADYIYCIKQLWEQADVFVVNISSPNTQGLRDLLKPEQLKTFLKPIMETSMDGSTKKNRPPILLKLSPDISKDELRAALDVSLELNIDGWILTNSTLERGSRSTFPATGGVSGKPLADKARAFLDFTLSHLKDDRKDRLVVSCGGIISAEDVFERLEMGANLTQVYTSLIYNGPFFFRDVAAHVQI